MAFTPISSLPTSPARNMPAATFVPTMDAWIAALPTWTSQVNALAAVLDADATAAEAAAVTASNAAASASATANATAWVSGGTYAQGVNVWSLVNYGTYRCKTAVSGSTTDPSSDTTHWTALTTLQAYQQGGAVTNPMSSNVTLTNNSSHYQSIAPNATGFSVTLPAANTMPSLGSGFALRNNTSNGAYPVAVNDGAGNLLSWAMPGRTVPLMLEANGSTAGTWHTAINDLAQDNGMFWWGAPITNNTASSTVAGILPNTQNTFASFGLNPTTLVTVAPSGQLKVSTYSDNSSKFVSTLSLTSSYNPATMDICENGTWEVLVCYPTSTGATGPTVQSVAINSSTLVPTSNVIRTGASVTVTGISIDNIASGESVLVYAESTTNKAWVAIVSGTGAGTTLNTAVQLSATTGMINAWCCGLTSTLAHCMYTDGSSMYWSRVTIASGTTPTVGTTLTFASAGTGSLGMANAPYAAESVMLSATQSLHAWLETTDPGLYATIVTDNGSVITQTTPVKLQTNSNGTGIYGMTVQAIYKMPNAALLVMFSNGTERRWATLRVIGGAPVLSPLTSSNDTCMVPVRSVGAVSTVDFPSCSVKSVGGMTAVPVFSVVHATAATIGLNIQYLPLCTA